MAQNLISATLSETDAVAIEQSLQEVKSKLGFLLSLQPADISSIIKVGNAYQPFLEKAYQALQAHPQILPEVFNKEEFIRDYNLFNAIRPLLNQLNEIAESLQNTYYAVGSDAFVAALEIYAAVKQNKDKVPGLNVTADEMSVFFKKAKAKTQAKAQ
jgi:hypothetical protein